jgi:hypothetical protein
MRYFPTEEIICKGKFSHMHGFLFRKILPKNTHIKSLIDRGTAVTSSRLTGALAIAERLAALRLAADTTYGNGEFLQWLADRDITPYMRTRDSIHRKRKWSVMSIRIYG